MYTKGTDGNDERENEAERGPFPGGPSIRSDGQLYNYQNYQNYREDGKREVEALPEKSGIADKLRRVIGGFETDDLLLIAIGILLLLDGDGDNDVLLVFILALLFL